MELLNYIDATTVEGLKRLLPSVKFEPIITPMQGSPDSSVSIELPVPPRADYGFVVYLKPERQISAQLVGQLSDLYFWYMPFEDSAFGYSVEKLDGAFFDALQKLISYQTRIIQVRGMVWHSFECDYNLTGTWNKICRFSALRVGGFKVPAISARKHIYHSPPLKDVA